MHATPPAAISLNGRSECQNQCQREQRGFAYELSNPLKENGAQGRSRTADTAIFSRMLYQLSYLGLAPHRRCGDYARRAGLAYRKFPDACPTFSGTNCREISYLRSWPGVLDPRGWARPAPDHPSPSGRPLSIICRASARDRSAGSASSRTAGRSRPPASCRPGSRPSCAGAAGGGFRPCLFPWAGLVFIRPQIGRAGRYVNRPVTVPADGPADGPACRGRAGG